MKDKWKSRSNRPARREAVLRWTGEKLVTKVEKMVPGGQAMTRHEGQVVFVPGVLPGEEIEIELSQAKGGYRRSRLLRIINPSADRVVPDCPHYGRCGGCDLQHASHSAQIGYKIGILEDTLRRQGGFGLSGILPKIKVESSSAWEYRNRMQFHFQNGRYGLKQRSSDLIELIEDCPVAAPEIREWLRGQYADMTGQSPENTAQSEGDLLFSTDPRLILDEEPAGGSGRLAVYGAQGHLARGDETFSLELGGKTISFDVRGFFQSNAGQLERLVATLAAWIDRIGPIADAADLYCGCGVFAALLPASCSRIEAVDNNPVNCRYARLNTDPARTRVFEGDVDAWLEDRAEGFPDLVIVDPPRSGLSRPLLGRLASEGPRHLFFVSCDAVTFSRDLKDLLAAGYVIRDLVLLDFYPQTSHIETACWLERP